MKESIIFSEFNHLLWVVVCCMVLVKIASCKSTTAPEESDPKTEEPHVATDFALACTPGNAEIPKGSSIAVLCNLEPLGGFEGSASFVLLDSQLPPGVDIEIDSEVLSTFRKGRTATLLRLGAEESASGTGSVKLEATSIEYGKAAIADIKVEIVTGRPEVRLIYLVPADREAYPTFSRVLERMGRHLQLWISDQLGDRRTISLNNIPVEIYRTSRSADSYAFTDNGHEVNGFWNNVVNDGLALTGGSFDDPDNIWVFFIDAQPLCDQTRAAAALHVAVLDMENNIRSLDGLSPRQRCEKEDRSAGPQSLWIGTLGHELGHNLGLPHPPGCGQEGGNCDSDALMWLGTWNYPDTYLREDEQNTLRRNPFVTRVSVPEQIFKPEELQAEGVFMHPAGDNAKVFTSFRPGTTPFIPLSCMSSKHKVLQGRPSGEAWR